MKRKITLAVFDFRFATNKITRKVDELQLNKTPEPM